MARLGATPEDFVVDEVPLYAPSGRGEHTFLRIEKRERTTEEVARALARAARVRPRDVGYAGRKDRRALARQWFSVPGLDPGCADALRIPGVRVLEAARHEHKLRTGQLRANRFELVVREVDAALAARACARLAVLEHQGMPNRFGAQRFGRDGSNVARARALLAGGVAGPERREARFLLSALQAAIFNQVLAERPLPLDAVERGDVARVRASGGLFRVEDLARELPRARSGEISATGPIFGTRVLEPAGAVAARERAVAARLGVEDPGSVRVSGVRLRGARRPLRVWPEQAGIEHRGDALHLRFGLPPGSYATVFVAELLDGAALHDG